MASYSATPNFHLNIWSGGDKPKRSDFNGDNQKVDLALFEQKQGLAAHKINQDLHVSPAERQKWNAGPTFLTTTYTGDGSKTRQISLGGQPRFALLFAVGKPLTLSLSNLGIAAYSGVAVPGQSSAYCALTSNGIEVRNLEVAGPDGTAYRLNESGTTYVCLYLK